jgi:hypothetical protein
VNEKIEPTSEGFVDRASRCLAAIDHSSDDKRRLHELWQFAEDVSPERLELIKLKCRLSDSNRRRKIAESRIEEMRHGLERLLCDMPGKRATFREVEHLFRQSSPECD